jgi:hypothetical protein
MGVCNKPSKFENALPTADSSIGKSPPAWFINRFHALLKLMITATSVPKKNGSPTL